MVFYIWMQTCHEKVLWVVKRNFLTIYWEEPKILSLTFENIKSTWSKMFIPRIHCQYTKANWLEKSGSRSVHTPKWFSARKLSPFKKVGCLPTEESSGQVRGGVVEGRSLRPGQLQLHFVMLISGVIFFSSGWDRVLFLKKKFLNLCFVYCCARHQTNVFYTSSHSPNSPHNPGEFQSPHTDGAPESSSCFSNNGTKQRW